MNVGNIPSKPEDYARVGLVLQGGGALGAYQAGVYEALHINGIEPHWVTGVSIGAINAAIIAGNPPELRVEKLRMFWEKITDRKIWLYTPDGDIFRVFRNTASSLMTVLFGQPGFFSPRQISPWLSPIGAKDSTSFYDVTPLKDTLLQLVDFDLLNNSNVRFSAGAVNVRSGNFVYFDSNSMTIGPEHIMASGALPPAFPMVQIGSDYYWDGGIVSNTPLQHLLSHDSLVDMLVFQVDLFSSRGALPRDMQQVMARQKDITYASRTRYNTDVFRLVRRWKRMTYEALQKIPEELLSKDEIALKMELARLPEVTICQLIYQQQAYEGDSKDYEFSGTSMVEHWKAGLADTTRTLAHREWLRASPAANGVKVYDVHLEKDYSDYQADRHLDT